MPLSFFCQCNQSLCQPSVKTTNCHCHLSVNTSKCHCHFSVKIASRYCLRSVKITNRRCHRSVKTTNCHCNLSVNTTNRVLILLRQPNAAVIIMSIQTISGVSGMCTQHCNVEITARPLRSVYNVVHWENLNEDKHTHRRPTAASLEAVIELPSELHGTFRGVTITEVLLTSAA